MSAIDPIGAATAAQMAPLALPLGGQPLPTAQQSAASFSDMLSAVLSSVDAKIGTADALVKRFALGDDIPIHQVTIALEEARLAVEVTMQVRSRLVEVYRDFMTMQV